MLIFKKLIMVFFSSILMFFSAHTAGSSFEDWQNFANNEKGERFFYDRASIIYKGNHLITVWIKVISDNASVTRTLVEIDCYNKVIREIRIIKEDRVVMDFSSQAPIWEPVEHNPSTMKLFQILCK